MLTTFKLHPRIQKALTKIVFSSPTQVQAKAIPLALTGADLFITAPTGTGKTAAFILPILQNLLEKGSPGKGIQALIIAPTRELVTQIQKNFQTFAQYTFFESLLITGGEPLKEQAAKLRKNPDVVIGTPGRLLEHWKTNQLILTDINIVVLDEADRMLDMGFGEDVMTLIDHLPSNRQTLLLSATKGNNSLQLIASKLLTNPQFLHLHADYEISTSIFQQVVLVKDAVNKAHILSWLLRHEKYQQAIIFTNTKSQADLLGKQLAKQLTKHLILHSDIELQERKQIIRKLEQNHANILIATDIAARGLDLPQMDLIINFDLPNTTEEYIHRVGRTGRIGKTGTAISLILPTNLRKLNRIEQDTQHMIERKVIPGLTDINQELANKKIQPQSKKGRKDTKTAVKAVDNSKHKTRPSTIISNDGFAPLKRKK